MPEGSEVRAQVNVHRTWVEKQQKDHRDIHILTNLWANMTLKEAGGQFKVKNGEPLPPRHLQGHVDLVPPGSPHFIQGISQIWLSLKERMTPGGLQYLELRHIHPLNEREILFVLPFFFFE